MLNVIQPDKSQEHHALQILNIPLALKTIEEGAESATLVLGHALPHSRHCIKQTRAANEETICRIDCCVMSANRCQHLENRNKTIPI